MQWPVGVREQDSLRDHWEGQGVLEVGYRNIGKLSWDGRSRLKHKELYIPIESKEFHLAKTSKGQASYLLGPKETDHSLGTQMALISLLSLHSLDNLLILIHELTCLPTLTGWHPIQIDYNFLVPQFKLLWEGICLVALSFHGPICYARGRRITRYRREFKGRANFPMRELKLGQAFQNRSTRYAILKSLNFILNAMFNSS